MLTYLLTIPNSGNEHQWPDQVKQEPRRATQAPTRNATGNSVPVAARMRDLGTIVMQAARTDSCGTLRTDIGSAAGNGCSTILTFGTGYQQSDLGRKSPAMLQKNRKKCHSSQLSGGCKGVEPCTLQRGGAMHSTLSPHEMGIAVCDRSVHQADKWDNHILRLGQQHHRRHCPYQIEFGTTVN